MVDRVISHSVEETEAFGAALAPALHSGAVLALFGGMGMGKTALVRGIARGMGLTAPVSSPTFALVHDYGGTPPLVHFDMYRVSGWDDLYSTGFFDYLASGARTSKTLCLRMRFGCIFLHRMSRPAALNEWFLRSEPKNGTHCCTIGVSGQS